MEIYEYKAPSKKQVEDMRLKRLIEFKRECRSPQFKRAMNELMGEDAVNVYLNRATLAEAVFDLEENKPVNFLDISKIILDD